MSHRTLLTRNQQLQLALCRQKKVSQCGKLAENFCSRPFNVIEIICRSRWQFIAAGAGCRSSPTCQRPNWHQLSSASCSAREELHPHPSYIRLREGNQWISLKIGSQKPPDTTFRGKSRFWSVLLYTLVFRSSKEGAQTISRSQPYCW